ncbi:AAA family ATPase [Bacillus cereus]|uniref:AAA family ATPase n=1 Tax=Bacillus cereus TaxID=1396 RepID=UPI0010BE3AB7|nr:SMC family ATPase [Bacillus cereus]TKH39137.1 SMC family ATPase [Bacillus cereus]
MKIKQINIENFRCFKGAHSFEINGETIILYGENGYGKSSFFDAVEWCLTGSVDRFRQPGEKNIDKSIILNRLAKSGETCSVELRIEGIALKRSFNVVEKPRESVVIRDVLSNNVLALGKENVENYIKEKIALKTTNRKLFNVLMKKSHILSQDQITDFVLRDNPKDRFNSLADIMGYRQLMNLVNNLKVVKDHLNRNVKKQNNSIKTYKEIVQSKENEKLEVDVLEINGLLKEAKIDINHSNILDELNKREGVLASNIGMLELKVSQLRKLSDNIKGLSYTKLKNKETLLKAEIENSFERRKRIESLLNKISEENKLILKNKSNMNAQKKLFTEREQVESEILALETSLNNVVIKEEEIDDLIKKEEQKQQELIYAKTHLQSYRSSISVRERTPEQIEKQNEQINRFNWRLNNAKKYLEIFQGYFSEGNESTSLNSLNNAIQDVYNYIVNNKERICPVCSTDKGDKLPSVISGNIKKNLHEIAQKSNKVSKVNEIIKRIRQKITYLEKEKLKTENAIKELEINFSISKENLSGIQSNIFFNRYMFEIDYKDLGELLDSSLAGFNTLKNYKIQFYNLNSLKNKLKDLPQKNLEADQKKYNGLNSRSFILQKREGILSDLEEIEIKNIHTKQKEYEELNQNIFLLSKILLENQEHEQIQSLINDFEKEISRIESQLKKIKEAYSLYQKVDTNTKIEANIKKFRETILEKEKHLKFYKTELENIDQHRGAIYAEIGSEASELLNKSDSSIQKYFRYLNPVPSVNKVLFNSPSTEELEIVLAYEHESADGVSLSKSNVQYSLSSGQLYVLAISIFLAINETQNVSKLGFLGIDDPIQNMDDVNQFSICDVLSSINKQLIFSTHDFEFLKLFLKKNEHKKESIQIFMLEHDDYSVTKVKEINFVN